MPRTRTQRIVFSILMAFAMVYGMELYNQALLAGGLSGAALLLGGAVGGLGDALFLFAGSTHFSCSVLSKYCAFSVPW